MHMRPIVATTFVSYTISHESCCDFPYCDTLNLVTTADGNLIDAGARNGMDCSPAAMAPMLALPWLHRATGAPATRDEIAAAFVKCKNAGLSQHGGWAYQHVTDLMLTKDALNKVVADRLEIDDAEAHRICPAFDSWPADAQFAYLAMQWAMGADFDPVLRFAKFHAAVTSDPPDFEAAARECFFQGGGVLGDETSRNQQNQEMFLLAHMAQKQGWDFDQTYWIPGGGPSASPTVPPARIPDEIPTVPALPTEALDAMSKELEDGE